MIWGNETPVVLAPMAGIADPPFRRLCRELGADATPAEMITSDTRLWSSEKTRLRLARFDDESPRIIQIAGSEPRQMAEAARQAVDLGAGVIDINMGCPAKKVCSKLAGSALLADESLIARILEAVVAAVTVPVTLKIRTGPSPDQRNGVSVATIAQASGIQGLTVHGRTRACRFEGDAEYQTIAAIKAAVRIPVLANGDIDSPKKALEVLRLTGADGVMVGRAARGQPWLLLWIKQSLKNVDAEISAPTVPELHAIIRRHLESLYSFYGAKRGTRIARKHLSWYCHTLGGSALLRRRLVKSDCANIQLRLAQELTTRSITASEAA